MPMHIWTKHAMASLMVVKRHPPPPPPIPRATSPYTEVPFNYVSALQGSKADTNSSLKKLCIQPKCYNTRPQKFFALTARKSVMCWLIKCCIITISWKYHSKFQHVIPSKKDKANKVSENRENYSVARPVHCVQWLRQLQFLVCQLLLIVKLWHN
jgi:hypothetical protein